MASLRFSKLEVVLSQPRIEISHRNFVCQYIFFFPNECHHRNRTRKYFRLYGRHLKKLIWRHNFTANSPITTKFDRLMQNVCRWLYIGQNRNRKHNSNVAAVPFPKPEVVLSQPWIEIFYQNLASK